jgi:transcriptional regulator with XRE-family HTH domain
MSANDSADQKKPFRVYSTPTLGAAIRHFRTASGLSQTELALRTGIPRNYINALESGREKEYLSRLLEILRELNVQMTLNPVDQ